MKLIKVTEAAERLGVSRQTLENWGKNGTLRIRTMSKEGNSHWVDADTIDALGDTIQDIENARKRLQQEQELIRADYRKEREIRKDIERELYMVDKFGKAALYCKEFYMSIPIMLNELGLINYRESQIIRDVINGTDLGWIAQDYGLTRTRIAQIFYKGCRKARDLSTIKMQLNELSELKNEMAQMKAELKIMNDELKVQRAAEQELQEMDEEDRIKHIKETDEMLKLLNTRLVDCDLTVRSMNCLNSADLKTIGDLARLTRSELLRFRNFGKKSLRELEDFLDSKGLSFGTDVDKIYRDRIAQRLQEID